MKQAISHINGGFVNQYDPLESKLAIYTKNHKNIKAFRSIIPLLGIYSKEIIQPSMVAPACNLTTREAGAGGP
jgi:hypothetical protein